MSAARLSQRLENPLLPTESCDPGALYGEEGKAQAHRRARTPDGPLESASPNMNQIYPPSSAGGGEGAWGGKEPDLVQVLCVSISAASASRATRVHVCGD